MHPADLVAARPALAMHAYDGLLFDGVRLGAIAAEIGTPVWVYGADTLRARARALTAALAPARVHYAVKANDHLAILAMLAAEGLGADVVSGGELARALHAGMPPARIVFSGVGKTGAEIGAALAAGIAQINVESPAELDQVAAVARQAGRMAAVALRINPDIDAGGHDKISTGRARDKFGIPLDEVARLYRHAIGLDGVRPVGLAVHIGSQIGSLAPYRTAFAAVAGLVRALREQDMEVSRVDCGGGLGIAYAEEAAASPEAFGELMRRMLGGLDVALMAEPGRWLAGPAGVLLTRVILSKQSGGARIVVLDAGMNDLARPALYGAAHGIVPISPALLHADLAACDVVGPVCESSDVFARGRLLPELAPDEVVAILDAGAYGAVMSSTYNARPLAAQVLVERGSWRVIRPRQEMAALWRGEAM